MDSRKAPQRGNVGLVALVIIILVLGLLGGFLFHFKNQQITSVPQPSTQQKRAETTTAPADVDTTLLYPNINWIPKSQTKSTLAIVRVANDKTNQTIGVNLSGKTWMYEKKGIKTLEELNKDREWGTVLSYYQSKLSDWTQSIKSENYTIEAISADGGGASMMGYIKKTNDTIRVISLYAQTTYAKGDFPIDADCPCTTQYQLFISDVLPLNTIITPQPTQEDTQLNQSTALTLANNVLGPCDCKTRLATVSQQNGIMYVTITDDGLTDDSIKAYRIVARASLENGSWTLGAQTKTQACWPDRGHQDFSSAYCE